MRLNELYIFEGPVDLDRLEDFLKRLESLLADPRMRLVPIFVNPPMFPGDHEWNFYDQWIRPILKRTGWKLLDEHLPIFNEWTWDGDYPKEDDPCDAGGCENGPSVWDDIGYVIGSMLEPKTGEAERIKSDPKRADGIVASLSSRVRQLGAFADQLDLPLIVFLPGDQSSNAKSSRAFDDIWSSRDDDDGDET